MKYIASRYYVLQVAMLATIAPGVLYAQNCGDGQLCNPLAGDMSLMQFVTFLVKDVLVGIIAPIVLTLALLYSGFMFISAQGNDAQLAKAKNNFLMVIVGGILLLGAYVILEVITNTVDQLTV